MPGPTGERVELEGVFALARGAGTHALTGLGWADEAYVEFPEPAPDQPLVVFRHQRRVVALVSFRIVASDGRAARWTRLARRWLTERPPAKTSRSRAPETTGGGATPAAPAGADSPVVPTPVSGPQQTAWRTRRRRLVLRVLHRLADISGDVAEPEQQALAMGDFLDRMETEGHAIPDERDAIGFLLADFIFARPA